MPTLCRATEKELFNKVAFEQRLKVNETNSSLGRRTGESQDPMVAGALGVMWECGNESSMVSIDRSGKSTCRHRTGGHMRS